MFITLPNLSVSSTLDRWLKLRQSYHDLGQKNLSVSSTLDRWLKPVTTNANGTVGDTFSILYSGSLVETDDAVSSSPPARDLSVSSTLDRWLKHGPPLPVGPSNTPFSILYSGSLVETNLHATRPHAARPFSILYSGSLVETPVVHKYQLVRYILSVSSTLDRWLKLHAWHNTAHQRGLSVSSTLDRWLKRRNPGDLGGIGPRQLELMLHRGSCFPIFPFTMYHLLCKPYFAPKRASFATGHCPIPRYRCRSAGTHRFRSGPGAGWAAA